jgi:hypothetical protein
MILTKVSSEAVGLLTLASVAVIGLLVVGSTAWTDLSDQGPAPSNVLPLAVRTSRREVSLHEGRIVPRPSTANADDGITLLQNWEYTILPPPVSHIN